MNTSAPKRYAHSLIRHFIIIALFFPVFYTGYKHVYYQDVPLTGILAILIIINILHKWPLNFRRNGITALALIITLIIYNIAAYVNYRKFELVFWKTEPINVTIAFLFFITLLILRDYGTVISDKVIRLNIGAILVHNIAGIVFRICGGGRFYMYHLTYEYFTFEEMSNTFSWMYYDPSEYALVLLLSMALFMVYQKLFPKRYLYYISQGILVVCMLLTNVSIYYIATIILLAGDLLCYLIKRFSIPSKIVGYSYPVAFVGCGVFAMVLYRVIGSLQHKLLIWKGTWDYLQDTPQGLYITFSFLTYEVPGVDVPILHAHNTFLNHMLRHSLWTGIFFLILFLILWVAAFVKKPNYRSLCILFALLFPITMDYGLQTLHLPLVLFLMYCIFFRPETDRKGGSR